MSAVGVMRPGSTILIAKVPPDMCFTVRVKIRTPSPEPGSAGLKAVCIWMTRDGIGPKSPDLVAGLSLSPASAKPVTDSSAAAMATTTTELRRTTDHPSPGSPCPQNRFCGLLAFTPADFRTGKVREQGIRALQS